MPIPVPDPAPAVTYPTGSGLIPGVWDELPGYVRDADDGTLYAYLDAAVAPADPVVSLMASGAGMVDPAVTPTDRLPWVAALAGVDITGVPNADLRTFIASATTRYRGNRAAMLLRVKLTLTGAKTVEVIHPYSGSVWRILVRTFTSETPDAAVTLAAIRREVPAWLRLTAETVAGQSYTNLAADYSTYGVMAATGKTYSTLAQEI